MFPAEGSGQILPGSLVRLEVLGTGSSSAYLFESLASCGRCVQARAQLIELHLTMYQEIDLDLVRLALFEMNMRVAYGVVVGSTWKILVFFWLQC